jgi:ABC-type sulfate transport system permease subunit
MRVFPLGSPALQSLVSAPLSALLSALRLPVLVCQLVQPVGLPLVLQEALLVDRYQLRADQSVLPLVCLPDFDLSGLALDPIKSPPF